jgi:hypothetical protein
MTDPCRGAGERERERERESIEKGHRDQDVIGRDENQRCTRRLTEKRHRSVGTKWKLAEQVSAGGCSSPTPEATMNLTSHII